MASTVPAKSQPLHNFYLPEWQWTKNHTNNHHRGRRTADSSSQQSSSPESAHRLSPPLDSLPRQSPMRDSVRRQSPIRDSVRRQSPILDSIPRQCPMRDSASRRSPMHDSQSPMRDSAVRRSPMNDSAVRRSPINDSGPRQSPMRDSTSRQSPMRDSTSRRSPMNDSAPRRSPMRDSTSRRSPMHDSAPRRSPPKHDLASESESGYPRSVKNGFTYDNRKSSAPESAKNGYPMTSSDQKIDNSGKRSTESDCHISATKEVRSKILIRIRPMNKPESDAHDEEKASTDGGEAEELAAKTWNLRPRRPIRKQSNANGGTSKVGGVPMHENIAQLPQAAANRSDSIWVRSGPDANAAEKEKKQKFSISLSRDEIEEDIFAMTGSKPARRPKKRVKIVQKQLDNLFPGLWLPPITADLYKVSEAPAKG